MSRSFFLGSLFFILMFLPSEAVFSGETQAQRDFFVLEDFSNQSTNGLPSGWKPQRNNPAPDEVYQLDANDGESLLRANGKPNRIFKKMKWNPHEYPFITWKWRMLKVPDDPDKERNATVYVALGTDLLGIPKLTKYAWSSLKAVGTEESGGMFRPTTIVIRSGQPENGEWITETINVLEDHKRLHNEMPPDEAYGFGIISTLEAEFGPFIVHKGISE
ncbi:MAG: DUF3047 domain-containing protein [Nitrospiria bacterium]